MTPGTLLVPDLALERWPSMDRYAGALAARLPVTVPDLWRTMRGPRFVARYVRYPRALRAWHPTLVHIADHSYAHCLRSFPGVPSVVTVHDLEPLRVMGEGQPGLRAALRDRMLGRVMDQVRRADRLIAGTAATADGLRAIPGVRADRVRVVGYGVDEAFFASPPADAVAQRRAAWCAALGVPSTAAIVLHVGSCVARKNVEGLIDAVATLRDGGRTVTLVQIGGTFTPAQRAAITAARLEGRVLQESWVHEPALHTAYHAADVLLFPSHAEGFGLPVLEALAAGLPVVSSGAGGLRESGGPAAVVVDPPEAGALAGAVGALLDDAAGTAARRDAGRAHARRHTWDAVADAIRAIYAELDARE